MTLLPVNSIAALLPCTGVLAVGVTSFREMERIPGLFGEGVCADLVRCVHRLREVHVHPILRCVSLLLLL
jgi:hypothetical protein